MKEGQRKSEQDRPTLPESQPEAAETLTDTFQQKANTEEEPEVFLRSEAPIRMDAAGNRRHSCQNQCSNLPF